jgi:Ca2+-binding EF-hand superfamily protein
MFHVMDKDLKGYISLNEYLYYIDIMMYGSEDEKLVQSFQLLDLRGNGEITFEDFNKIVHSFAKMWSAAIGTPSKFFIFPNLPRSTD